MCMLFVRIETANSMAASLYRLCKWIVGRGFYKIDFGCTVYLAAHLL